MRNFFLVGIVDHGVWPNVLANSLPNRIVLRLGELKVFRPFLDILFDLGALCVKKSETLFDPGSKSRVF